MVTKFVTPSGASVSEIKVREILGRTSPDSTRDAIIRTLGLPSNSSNEEILAKIDEATAASRRAAAATALQREEDAQYGRLFPKAS